MAGIGENRILKVDEYLTPRHEGVDVICRVPYGIRYEAGER